MQEELSLHDGVRVGRNAVDSARGAREIVAIGLGSPANYSDLDGAGLKNVPEDRHIQMAKHQDDCAATIGVKVQRMYWGTAGNARCQGRDDGGFPARPSPGHAGTDVAAARPPQVPGWGAPLRYHCSWWLSGASAQLTHHVALNGKLPNDVFAQCMASYSPGASPASVA